MVEYEAWTFSAHPVRALTVRLQPQMASPSPAAMLPASPDFASEIRQWRAGLHFRAGDANHHRMITLIQFPWSPFCITVRHILARNRIPYRIRNVPPNSDRSAVVRATKGRGYTVPCVIDGKKAVVDLSDFSQDVSRYLDRRFRLGLFPKDKEGVQHILARYIENDIEMVEFKVNDSYVIPKLPLLERIATIRHKERKFGRGCVQQWAKDRPKLNRQVADLLKPIDSMLASSPFLLGDRPLFVDYDLFGVLGNYLYNGKTKLPPLKNLRRWHAAMRRPPNRTRARR
jgi:glutathione S-transferase